MFQERGEENWFLQTSVRQVPTWKGSNKFILVPKGAMIFVGRERKSRKSIVNTCKSQKPQYEYELKRKRTLSKQKFVK